MYDLHVCDVKHSFVLAAVEFAVACVSLRCRVRDLHVGSFVGTRQPAMCGVCRPPQSRQS